MEDEQSQSTLPGPVMIGRILELLPHRYPFVLVDRVLEVEAGKRLVALKNVTINEPFFQGHFPAFPVMPGVLIVEALAQASALLAFFSTQSEEEGGEGAKTAEGRPVLLMGVDKARFRKKVEPGDQLRLVVELGTQRHGVWKFKCTALVDGARAATAEIMATLG